MRTSSYLVLLASIHNRVIIETTHGPLEMNLWCRECPSTTKFFLQLCMDGYFDDMVFHRIIDGFLVQSGAIRIQNGKETAGFAGTTKDVEQYRNYAEATNALDRRKYEMNSRIRFNHRGQVAMALAIEDDHNVAEMQPQFFITLDEAPNLDSKHVLFGTISGPTVFNAIRIGKTDVNEETNLPTDLSEAPRILRIKTMENPIHTDLVPSQICPWKMQQSSDKPAKKKKKRKGVKNVKLLSFGDEFEEEEGRDSVGGIKSSHDVIESKLLSKNIDDKVKRSVEPKSQKLQPPKMENTIQESEVIQRTTPSPSNVAQEKVEAISKQPSQMKTPVEKPTEIPKKIDKKQKVSILEARRNKYKKGSKDKQKREADTMLKLMEFQSKRSKVGKSPDDKDEGLASRMMQRSKDDSANKDDYNRTKGSDVVAYNGQVLDDGDDDQDRNDWMQTRFKCRKHMDSDARLGGDGRNLDDYAVVDEKSRGPKNNRDFGHSGSRPMRKSKN